MPGRLQRTAPLIALLGSILLAAAVSGPTSHALASADERFPEASPGSRAEATLLLSARTGFPARCMTPAARFARDDGRLARVPGVARALQHLHRRLALPGGESLSTAWGFPLRYTVQPAGVHRIDPADLDGNGTPDLIDAVLQGLGEARKLLVEELGFADPAIAEVALADLGRGIDGYTIASSSLGVGLRLVLPAAPHGGAADARNAARHQFAHAVVHGSLPALAPAWGEAFATWTALKLAGTPEPLLAERLSARLKGLRSGLGDSAPGLAAGNALWLAFVEQQYGMAAVRLTMEELGHGLPVPAALDRAVQRASTDDLHAAFREFHLWSILVGARADGLHFSFAENLESPAFAASVEGLPALSVHADPPLAPWGATQIRLEPAPGEGGMRVRFEGDFTARWEADLILVDGRGAMRRVSVKLSPEGGGECTVPLDDLAEALLLVRNVGSDDGAERRFTYAVHREKGYPFVLDTLRAVVQPGPGGGVLVSWDTSIEQELIGFNILRESENGLLSIAANPVLIPAMGDETHAASYHFLDHTAGDETALRYRVQGVTVDGLTSLSDPVSVLRRRSR